MVGADEIEYADERVKQHEREYHPSYKGAPLQGLAPMGPGGKWWSGGEVTHSRPKDRYGLWRRPGHPWYIRDLLSMNILATEVDHNFGVHVCKVMNEEWHKREEAKA